MDKLEAIAAIVDKLAISQAKTDAQMIETDKKIKEVAALQAVLQAEANARQARIDAQLAETDAQLARTDAQLAETDAQMAKTDARLNKLGKMVGGISNSQGDVAEEFFYNSIKAKPVLNQVHYDFVDKNVTRSKQGIEDEYDIVLVNGKDVAIIEVKYKAHQHDLARFLKQKYVNFRKLYPEYGQFRHHLALASFKINDEVKNEALQQGVMVLQRKGDLIEMTVPKGA